jgi:hypothetical protein
MDEFERKFRLWFSRLYHINDFIIKMNLSYKMI